MISLDKQESYHFNIKNLYKEKDFEWEFKREVFQKANKKKFEEALNPVLDAIQNAKIEKSDLNEIILFGGASKIPKILELLDDFFEGIKIIQIENPQHYVAKGAAIQAAMLESTIETPKKKKLQTPIESSVSTSREEPKKARRQAPTLETTTTQKQSTNEKKVDKPIITHQEKKQEKSSGCIIS